MLLVLKPSAFIFLSVSEGIDTITLAFSFYILAFIGIAILEEGASLA